MGKKEGRPRIIETPEKLMELFLEHYENYVFHRKAGTYEGEIIYDIVPRLVTIQSFSYFLKHTKKLVASMNYYYELNEEFSSAKKEIDELMFARYVEMGYDKEYSTAFLIFYGKNKFGMTDKVQSENVNINLNNEVTNLSDEELEKLLDDE